MSCCWGLALSPTTAIHAVPTAPGPWAGATLPQQPLALPSLPGMRESQRAGQLAVDLSLPCFLGPPLGLPKGQAEAVACANAVSLGLY